MYVYMLWIRLVVILLSSIGRKNGLVSVGNSR